MKKLFTSLFVLCAISFASAQTIYWSEGFDAGLPADWTIDGEWVVGTPAGVSSAYFTVPADAMGDVACFNDDGLGNGAVGGGTITTGAIDLTAVSGTVWVEMHSYFPNLDYQGNDETARISVSSDGGTTWGQAADLNGGEGAAWGVAFADLSAFAGSEIMLRFEYDDGQTWNYGWAFDDVQITDEITLAPQRSYRIHAGASVIMDDALEGIEYYNDGFIVNYGLETINSYDVTMTNGTSTITQSFTNVEIPYNSVGRYYMDEAVTVSGNTTWTVEISNVNGSADPDEDATDNSMDFNLNATSEVNPDKAVVVEEATGTWCPWCTRGTVYLDEMSKRFGKHFVGIAVHNNDPMMLNAYDGAITDFPNFSGFPSVVYQREEILDPSEIVNPSMNDMNTAPPAAVEVGAVLDGNSLTTSVEITFLEDVTEADYNVAIVLVEDGMTGTGGDWNQANAYGGGGNGPMGGYELLGGSVPAELMIYDHVGRALIGGFNGVANEVVGDYIAGTTGGFVFDDYNVPSDMNLDKVHIVGLLINDDGEIVNAISTSVGDAEDNGLYNPTSSNEVFDNTLAEVYPNPVKDLATVFMSVKEASDISVSLVNTVGQTVSIKDYGTMSGEFQLDYDMTGLNAGVYIMHIKADDKFITKKINKID